MALRISLLIVIGLLALSSAHAAEPGVGQSWPAIVQSLQAKGIQKIGALDLKTFSLQAKGIEWHSVSPEQIGAIADGRKSAYYLIDGKKVFVSTGIPGEVTPAVLELHEALGALGYNDKSYNLSAALLTLSEMPKGTELTDLTQSFGVGTFTKPQLQAALGGTSVGGGGDFIALTAKTKFVKTMLSDPKWRRPAMLAYLMQVNFEPFYDPKQQFMAFRYLTNAGHGFMGSLNEIPGIVINPLSGVQDQLTFYVPALWWRAEPAKRGAMIDWTVAYAGYLLPVEKGVAGQTQTYSCPSYSVSFMKNPGDEMVDLVQKSRFAVLTGCTNEQIFTEIRHPSFFDYKGKYLTEQTVDETAIVKGRCTFEAKGKTLGELTASFAKGSPGATGFNIALDAKSSLSGYVAVNAEGKITALQMVKIGPGGKLALNETKTLSKPSSSASMSAEALPGIQIQLSCQTSP